MRPDSVMVRWGVLESDDRLAGAQCLVDVGEVSGSGGCSLHNETDAAC